MPALQNLVLTDRQTTPVNHTFIPRSLKDEVATVVKAGSSGAPIEDMIFSISSRRVNGRVKSVVKLKVPVVTTETVNGVARTVLLREAYIDATFTFAADSTESERNNAVGMFANALSAGKVLVEDTIVKAQSIY